MDIWLWFVDGHVILDDDDNDHECKNGEKSNDGQRWFFVLFRIIFITTNHRELEKKL